MYISQVPVYLAEDHPLEFPEATKDMIKEVGESKGNVPAFEVLDIKLKQLYKNCSVQ